MEIATPWQEATQWLQVLGLALILIFATVIFVRGVTLAIRGRHQAVRFGVELLLVFTVLFLFSYHALRMAGVSQFIFLSDRNLRIRRSRNRAI